MAGQFAKPRSALVETREGVTLPAYQGDIVNQLEFSPTARTPDPERMLSALTQALHTRDIVRERVFLSHECLLLPYEEAMLRPVSVPSDANTPTEQKTKQYFSSSAHFLWLGERTRQIAHAHAHFLSRLVNPIGVKISEKITSTELLQLLELLNPANIPGRVSLITRMGAEKLRMKLPELIHAAQDAKKAVIWLCDPLHANTEVCAENKRKTRFLHKVEEELLTAVEVHRECGSHFGGVHLEMTGKHVSECVGGSVTVSDLESAYHTACDPRLNGEQALHLCEVLCAKLRPPKKESWDAHHHHHKHKI